MNSLAATTPVSTPLALAGAGTTPRDIPVSYNAQDRHVMPSETITLSGVLRGPAIDKATMAVDAAKLHDGAYTFADTDTRIASSVSFAAVTKTLRTFEAAFGQPVSWSFGEQPLVIFPDEGEMLNAYYTVMGGSVNFFHATDPVTGAHVLSGASGEVVSHETGHAILDAVRPNYLGSFVPDTGAFHESFGDMMAMLMALQDERTLNRVMVETRGDLSQPNCVAQLGEELGKAINDTAGYNRTGGDWTRNAINDFKWQDPSTLPVSGDPTHLGNEVHSFSRLWTGAFYEVLTKIQADHMAGGMAGKEALQATGAEGLALLVALLKVAPQGEFTYNDMAHAFVQAAGQVQGGARRALVEQVFRDRLILQDAPPAPPPPSLTSSSPAARPLAPLPEVGLSPSGVYTMTPQGRVPIESVTRPITVRLQGDDLGVFDGAQVQVRVDRTASFAGDGAVADRTTRSLRTLIHDGAIRFNPPGYEMTKADAFRADGQPYAGYVRWDGDRMIIERNRIAT
jgi:hypothetical protein